MTTPSMKPGGDKYITFKRSEFSQWCQDGVGLGPDEVEDAVVLRGQDVFTPPVFWAYAQSLITHAEIMESFLTDPETDKLDDDSKQMIKEITGKADLFSEIAQWAHELTTRKIPD